MFKSSENLRLAAEMRALERVAAPWRQTRRTWFDGTPDSIAARLAATDRVLVHARAGYTGAHVALEREAAHARAELLAAQHRLMTDFLDDGARAFKGSKRVAGEPILDLSSHGGESGSSTSLRHRDDQANNRFTLQHPEGYGDRARVVTNHDDTELMSADGMHHWAGRRVATDEWADTWRNTVQPWPDMPAHQREQIMQDAVAAGAKRPQWHQDRDKAIGTDTSHEARRVTADESTGFGDYPLGPGYDRPGFGPDDIDEYENHLHDHDYHVDDLHALEHKLRPGFDEDDPARYSRRTASVADFDDQLLFDT